MPFGGMLTMGLIAAGTSIAGSALGGNKNKSTSNTTPSWTPDQQGMQGDLFQWLKSRMTGGGADFTPQKNLAMGGINSTYNDVSNRMNNSLTARGFGESGKVGTNLQKIELGRAGALAKNEGTFADMKRQQDNFDIAQAMQFAFASPGQKNESTGTQGTPLGNGINSGAQTATFLYALNNMMGGGAPSGLGTLDTGVY